MPSERDKASENPYESPSSDANATLDLRAAKGVLAMLVVTTTGAGIGAFIAHLLDVGGLRVGMGSFAILGVIVACLSLETVRGLKL